MGLTNAIKDWSELVRIGQNWSALVRFSQLLDKQLGFKLESRAEQCSTTVGWFGV